MFLIACQSEMPSTSSGGSAYGDTVPRSVLLIKNSTHGSELEVVCTNGSNFRIDVKTPPKLASFVPTLARLSIGDALHKLACKRVRRYRTAVLLIKNSTHGSVLALVCTVEKLLYRRQDPTKTRIVCTNLSLLAAARVVSILSGGERSI